MVIFILNEDVVPPINFILDNNSFWLLSLKILKDCVIEPVLVKTVSNFILSALNDSRAFGLVINDSFLQEKNNSMDMMAIVSMS